MSSTATPTLRRTPLFDRHVAAGAKLVDFAGWEMPVQYDGVAAEHRAVREACGIFDVSHMGEIEVSGPHAAALLQRVLSNDVERLGAAHQLAGGAIRNAARSAAFAAAEDGGAINMSHLEHAVRLELRKLGRLSMGG